MWKSFRIKIPLPHPVTPVQAQQDRSPRAMAGTKASLICPHGTSPSHCWTLEDMLSLMLERSRGREQIKVASAELLPGLPGPFAAPSLLKHSHGWHPFTPANKPGVLVQSFPPAPSQLLPLLTERTKSCSPHTQLCHSCDLHCPCLLWESSTQGLPLFTPSAPLNSSCFCAFHNLGLFSARIWVYNLLTPLKVPSLCAGMFKKSWTL